MKKVALLFSLTLLAFNCTKLLAQSSIVSTIAGYDSIGFWGDGGPATSALFWDPAFIIKDNSGNLYVSDFYNNRVRKITPSGTITTIAGNGSNCCISGDGGPATDAPIGWCAGLAFDAAGNLYIVDEEGERVRKVDSMGIISTVAGNGTTGNGGDGGPATSANLHGPKGIAFDAFGNLYITDMWNYCVRKVDTNGIITKFAGNGVAGNSGDGGPATAASLYSPWGVVADNLGNVYISDESQSVVRKVNASGTISRVAGTGAYGFSGDGGPATTAQINYPGYISMDMNKNLLVCDASNNCVRKIDTMGIITTIVGIPDSQGYTGNGGPATAAKFYHPIHALPDSDGGLYIADCYNQCIRYICYTGDPTLHITSSADSTIISGIHVTFTATYTYGGAYPGFQWLKNGIAVGCNCISYEDSSFVNGDVVSCIITSSSLCTPHPSDTSNYIIVNVIPLKTDLGTKLTGVKIYPNPTTSSVNIIGAGGCEIGIYDMLGQLCGDGFPKTEGPQININTAKIPNGVYSIVITDPKSGEKVVRKLVKE